MIDIRADDIVAERNTNDGRFVLFTRTDLPPRYPLPFLGVSLDTGGDCHGIIVRLVEADGAEGWTALDLLLTVQARAKAEAKRRATKPTIAMLYHLAQAVRSERLRRPSRDVSGAPNFRPGNAASSYPWTVAEMRERTLPLCPDPESREGGVTPEQLLIVLDQLYADVAAAQRSNPFVRNARLHVGNALTCEQQRLVELRG